jgi:hypothetical protein
MNIYVLNAIISFKISRIARKSFNTISMLIYGSFEREHVPPTVRSRCVNVVQLFFSPVHDLDELDSIY